MRTTISLLLLMMTLAGCASPPPPPVKWAFKDAFSVPKKDQCDTSGTRENPVVGTLQAHGLGPHGLWMPGWADKINWVEEPGSPQTMDLELRRPGSDAVAYRLHRSTGPSNIAFPEPGCWDLTIRTTAKTAAVRIYLEPARPAGLLTSKLPNPIEEPQPFQWRDEAFGLKLLDAAAAFGEPGPARKSALLWMVWRAPELSVAAGEQFGRWLSPLVYAPAGQGEEAQVVMAKSLITGDCRDANKPVAAAIKPELASQIEKALSSHWVLDDSEKNPWHLYSADCTRFEKP